MNSFHLVAQVAIQYHEQIGAVKIVEMLLGDDGNIFLFMLVNYSHPASC